MKTVSAVGIMDILKKINLLVPYFDYLYDKLLDTGKTI